MLMFLGWRMMRIKPVNGICSFFIDKLFEVIKRMIISISQIE
ncbi:hypothetical protein HMPREF3203_02586 [Proteus mirabilis]|nr:hypothetical protein HMPREF3203_02586 [Proteus mirabilis]